MTEGEVDRRALSYAAQVYIDLAICIPGRALKSTRNCRAAWQGKQSRKLPLTNRPANPQTRLG